jgi:hypothetical protein
MFGKKLFYLSDSLLSAWQWQGGKLKQDGEFTPDAEGLARFDGYLGQAVQQPIHILVDVIEEDFRIETVPHVLGKDRLALHQRKLNQLFRGNTWRRSSPQGRESDGRRDDRLLLTGLTNEDLLKPWVERITRRKLPLAGIYSLPLLSEVLVKKLGLSAPHQLLITRQSTGLRQSYFQEGHIKFSRLTLLTIEDMPAMQIAVTREAQRTQQYLNSLRLLPRDQPLEVAMICSADYHGQFQPEHISTPMMRYRVLGLAEAAAQAGLKAQPAIASSELLFLHLLGRFPPPQHYAPAEQRWHYQLRLVRQGILGATAATLAATAWVAGGNLDQALADFRQSEQVTHETHAIRAQQQVLKQSFPPTPATPEDMKSAVELARVVASRDVTPHPLLAWVSQALEQVPAVRLTRFTWRADDLSVAADAPVQPVPAAAGQEGAVPEIILGTGKPQQGLLIEGEISPYTDYRSALDSVNRFVEALKTHATLQVTLLSKPVDLGTASEQKGRAGKKESGQALFSVKLTLPPAP